MIHKGGHVQDGHGRRGGGHDFFGYGEDIRAALAYAAEMTRERFVDIPMTVTT